MILERATDPERVSVILHEAALWMQASGFAMWRPEDVAADAIEPEVSAGHYRIARREDDDVGVVCLSLEDAVFWPSAPPDALYVHRLAVRRAFAGGDVSTSILERCLEEARGAGRAWLRLDCEADRAKLRRLYEEFGFRLVDERVVGSFRMARYEMGAARR